MIKGTRGARRRLRTGELPGSHILAGVSALAIGIAIPGIAIHAAATATLMPMFAAPAAAQDSEEVYRQEALAHARAISEAWRRIEDHILRRSAAPTRWSGSVPPAATGWLDAWTERGVRARYCGNTLLVYMEPEVLRYASTSRLKRGPMGSRPMKSSRRSAVSRRGVRPPSRTRTNEGLPKSRRPTRVGLSFRRSMKALTAFRRC